MEFFPIRTGLLNTRVMRRLMKREGEASVAVLLAILGEVYAEEGYYVAVDKEFCTDIADQFFHIDVDDVQRVLDALVELDFFDKEMFDTHGILTSAELQQHFLYASHRRKGVLIRPEYCLLTDEEMEQFRSGKPFPKSVKEQMKVAEKATEMLKNGTEKCKNGTEKDENCVFGCTNKTETKRNNTPPLTPPPGENEETGKREELTEERPSATHSTTDGCRTETTATATGGCTDAPCTPLPVATQGGRGVPPRRTDAPPAAMMPDMPPHERQPRLYTPEEIARMTEPRDGVKRNLQGLKDALRQFKVPPQEQYAIICKSNYGAIGGEVWKGIMTLYNAGGKIHMPGRYLLSILHQRKQGES